MHGGLESQPWGDDLLWLTRHILGIVHRRRSNIMCEVQGKPYNEIQSAIIFSPRSYKVITVIWKYGDWKMVSKTKSAWEGLRKKKCRYRKCMCACVSATFRHSGANANSQNANEKVLARSSIIIIMQRKSSMYAMHCSEDETGKRGTEKTHQKTHFL